MTTRLPANFGKPWSREEDEVLLKQWREGVTLAALARYLARTQSSVRLRLEKHGEIKPEAGA